MLEKKPWQLLNIGVTYDPINGGGGSHIIRRFSQERTLVYCLAY